MARQGGKNDRVVAENRRARHDYDIEETYEAGIELVGTEVKAVRQGDVNLRDAYAAVRNGELFLFNLHIGPYEQGNRNNHEPRRTRRLLLHRHEINRLTGAVQQRGYTLIPTRLYLRKGLIKIQLGLARGKRQYDKRQDIARRDAERRMDRALKERRQGREGGGRR